jgi:hypothetical protein
MTWCPECGRRWRSFDGDVCGHCGVDIFDLAMIAELERRYRENPSWRCEGGLSMEEFEALTADDE